MKILVNYNFKEEDIEGRDFHALYVAKRRDSAFAFAFEDGAGVTMLRDHLGNVPLFYRKDERGVSCSIFIEDLLQSGDIIDKRGLISYLSFGTAKIASLVKGIEIVPPGSVINVDKDGEVSTLYTYQFNMQGKYLREKETVEELDKLMLEAVRRTVVNEEVGIFLSGGIDSALVGIYLKKLEIKVNAYTSLPWGEKGTEAEYAKINAEVVGTENHSLVPLDTSTYCELVQKSGETYGNPTGITSQIGTISIFEKSLIGEEQVFFGQNADTLTCSMPAQYSLFFLGMLPRAIRNALHPWLGRGDYLSDYLSFVTKGQIIEVPGLRVRTLGMKRYQVLTIAGMLVGHTPSDGEIFSLPLVKDGKLFSNPFYDMDLIEFFLSRPIDERISFSRESPIGICFEKKLFRKLALKHLPRELVFRKKGLTIPFEKDDESRDFLLSLPKEINGIKLNHTEERMAADILNKFMTKYSLRFQ
ncbi:MAG: asparagine synthase-related protein [Thermodesulfobacteriota bacterium]